jgi:integrase
MSEERAEIKLRIPDALRRQLMQVARKKGVSLNADLTAVLEASLDQTEESVAEKKVADDSNTLAELQAENAQLRAKQAELEGENAQLRGIVSSQRPSALPGNLSASKITKLISDAKSGKLTKRWFGDGGNLVLQISNIGGAVSWIFRYDGRRFGYPGDVPMGLGSYPDVDLEMARAAAYKYRRMLAEDKDPKKERDNTKIDDLVARGLVKKVNQVVDEYLQTNLAGLSPTYRQQSEDWLKRFVRDEIGDWPIQKVNQNTILETCKLRDLWIVQHPTAKGVQNHLSRIFDLAIDAGYYKGKNPAALQSLRRRLPKSRAVHRTKHHDSLPYEDIGRFMEKLRAYRDKRPQYRKVGRTPVSLAVEFIILSGVRLNEARLARWSEIDLKHRVWTVPPEHLKMGHIHGTARPIPITEPMLAVLEEMQTRRIKQSPDAFVFPASWSDGGELNRANLSTFISKQLGWETHLNIHGFRSTLRELCRANRYPPEWRDIQADHSLGNKTSQSYGSNKLIEERRGMMEQFGKYCSKPAPEPTVDVINFADKKRSA